MSFAYLCIYNKAISKVKPKEFTSIKGGKAVRHVKNKSIWEPDYAGHGGSTWKVWLDEHAWADKRPPWSIGADGEILRGLKNP